MGSLTTIRGKWYKPSKLKIVVTGLKRLMQEISDDVLFRAGDVYPVLHQDKGRGPTRGRVDWKVDWTGTKSAPVAKEGEEWELIGVETGELKGYSNEVWREIGVQEQGSNGFLTYFEYIAMRRPVPIKP